MLAGVTSTMWGVLGAVVVLAGAYFALRNNLKTYWKELAGERAAEIRDLEHRLTEKAEELIALQATHAAEMLTFAEEQREIRHELKAHLAAAQNALTLEMAKHDLSAVVVKIDALHRRLDEHDGRLTQLLNHLEGT